MHQILNARKQRKILIRYGSGDVFERTNNFRKRLSRAQSPQPQVPLGRMGNSTMPSLTQLGVVNCTYYSLPHAVPRV